MIDIIPAENRHFTDMGWLQTYWLFSFSNYHDPANTNHGSLRVFNDDIVQPHKGFGIHPHEEMEIVSIVLQGKMEHKDTMGNINRIRQHDVQRMTAGTGLQHSEWNHADRPVHFFQVWIMPDALGLKPSYDQKNFNPESWKNSLTLLASNRSNEDIVSLNTDAQFYRAALDEGKNVKLSPQQDRNQFLYIIDGSATVNGRSLNKRDQARISGETSLTISAATNTDLILIDNP
jgi:redox-sensitive bicupin YhaK (pirin superfamily)